MNQEELTLIKQLLRSADKKRVADELRHTSNPLFLHTFAENYNWNDGFDLPEVILENNACDFGTGLLLFYRADGAQLLMDPDAVSHSSSKEWRCFLQRSHSMLINGEFSTRFISFDPELTAVQKYKLKIAQPDLPECLIAKSPGETIDFRVG